MKKLIMLLLIGASPAFCTLRMEVIDQQTVRYYSENPAYKNVNQNEYNEIIRDLVAKTAPRGGILGIGSYELARYFADWRLIGTPTLLQVMKDIEDFRKQFQQDVHRLQ